MTSRNGPGALNEFICLTGFDRLGTGPNTPTDGETFLALEMFAKHYGALEGWAIRETAKQCAIQRLKDLGFPRPWEIVRRAIDESIRLCTKEGGVQKRIFEPRPLSEWAADPEMQAETEWPLHGYLLRGGLTAIAALPKTGKTTLTACLAASVAGGFGFLDRQVRQTPVLWLDYEQHPARTLQMFADLGAVDLPIYLESNLAPGSVTAEQLHEYVTRRDVGLVVVDSLSKFWAGIVSDENDAAQVEAGIGPLLGLARETNIAVWVIHHSRKSGGDYGLDFRGSDALIATVDIAISMQRSRYQDEAGTQRILSAISRYQETPNELVVAYRDGLYTALGSAAEVKVQNVRANVLAALKTDEPLTRKEVAEATELKSGTLGPVLSQLYDEQLVEREGSGVRGDPWRYKRIVSVHEIPSTESNTETEKAA